MNIIPELDQIQKRRKNLNLTQKKLSMISGVSQSLIAKIESGKVNPSYSITKKIFETLESIERGNELKAKDILSSKIVYVNKDDSISKAIKLMKKGGYSQLPVFYRNQVVGSISEKTILNIISGGNLAEVLKQRVKNHMEDSFPVVNENTSLTPISALLKYNQAVMVTKKGKTIGIITKSDLFKVA